MRTSEHPNVSLQLPVHCAIVFTYGTLVQHIPNRDMQEGVRPNNFERRSDGITTRQCRGQGCIARAFEESHNLTWCNRKEDDMRPIEDCFHVLLHPDSVRSCLHRREQFRDRSHRGRAKSAATSHTHLDQLIHIRNRCDPMRDFAVAVPHSLTPRNHPAPGPIKIPDSVLSLYGIFE